MKGFKKFVQDDEEDYRKHDGKRDKKKSWKDEAREKREKREKSFEDNDD